MTKIFDALSKDELLRLASHTVKVGDVYEMTMTEANGIKPKAGASTISLRQYTALAAKQNVKNAIADCNHACPDVRLPPKNIGRKTKPFFSHCTGRISRISPIQIDCRSFLSIDSKCFTTKLTKFTNFKVHVSAGSLSNR